MTHLNRRQFIGGLAALPVAYAALGVATPPDSGVFQHGVASGDPDTDSVVLWTRVETARPDVPVKWVIARDRQFDRVIAYGEAVASQYRDHTVKVLAEGLPAGEQLFYRFEALGELSITGSTRTLPVGDLASLVLALASCSNFSFGYFNAYDAIARDESIDFVLHTGDYIYEYGSEGWGAEVGRKIGRPHLPHNEIVTLQDYRIRHAQYKRDAGSMAMHAAKPMLMLWDDHESANNPWMGGAQNHQATEGLWRDRRQASLRAYYEWMPVREPGLDSDRLSLWRHYRFGSLASLVTLESRHTGRVEQIDYESYLPGIRTQRDAERFEADILSAPGRTMLSAAMNNFLDTSLRDSLTAKRPWRILGNAVPLAPVRVPDVAAAGIYPPGGVQAVPGTTVDLAFKGRFALPFYLDTWDGYPWARQALFDTARSAGSCDLLVLTGDSHSFWANHLLDTNDRRMGIEIGTAGISSPGDFIDTGYDPVTAGRLDALFASFNPSVRWTDNLHQGYVRLAFCRDRVDVDYRAVSTVQTMQYSVETIRTEIILRDRKSLEFG